MYGLGVNPKILFEIMGVPKKKNLLEIWQTLLGENSGKRQQIAKDEVKKHKDSAVCSAQQKVSDIQLSITILEEAEKAVCVREQQHITNKRSIV